MPIITYAEIASESTSAIIRTSDFSELATSYPANVDKALALLETTMTSNAEREKAFKKAGLR